MIARKKVTILPKNNSLHLEIVKNNEDVVRVCSYTLTALSKVNSWRGSLVRIHGTYMYHPGAKGLSKKIAKNKGGPLIFFACGGLLT